MQHVPRSTRERSCVLRLPGWDHLLTEDGNLTMADLVSVTSSFQDWMMDELGRAWPEVLGPDGISLGVLESSMAGDEEAWFLAGRRVARIGDLRDVALR